MKKMMRKLYNLDTEDKDKLIEVYNKLQKDRKKIKRRAILMVGLLLGVNAFAWFAYIAKADFKFDATVVAWDVNFYADKVEVNDMVISVGNIYPGLGDTGVSAMNKPFTKTIEVNNSGDVKARFYYEIESFEILGKDLIESGMTTEEVVTSIKNDYPFVIDISHNKNMLNPGEKLNFIFKLHWLFDDANKYYKLNELYEFDPSYVYYELSNGQYVAKSVTSSNFATLRNNLYLVKDDADSYFGEKCAIYESSTGKTCISTKIKLVVEQTV